VNERPLVSLTSVLARGCCTTRDLNPRGLALDAEHARVRRQHRRDQARPVALSRTDVDRAAHVVDPQPRRDRTELIEVPPVVARVGQELLGVRLVGGHRRRVY
jgi:hypothetical protein